MLTEFLWGKTEGKKTFERHRHRWKGDMAVHLKEI
jgi:hypothetical protein